MASFILRHWRGRYGLGRSFWLHTVLVSLILTALLGAAVAWVAQVSTPRKTILATLASLVPALLIGIWQLVGLWRSAVRARRQADTAWARHVWPGVAQATVLLVTASTLYSTGAQTIDSLRMMEALSAPDLRDYAIERHGTGEVALIGALNDDSVDDAIAALRVPGSRVLTITSHGGLMKPAGRLARFVRDANLRVVADGECASACTVVLAASPYAAITEGTRVTFHRPEPVVAFVTPGLNTANEARARSSLSAYRDFGIAPWAVETMARQQYWTPSLAQLVDMGLLASVYLPRRDAFVWARDYCGANPRLCAAGGPAMAAEAPYPETAELPLDD